MAVLSIEYCGGNYEDENTTISHPIKYKCVYLYTRDEEHKFESGNFLKDWFLANKKFLFDEYAHETSLFYSHSVKNFITDGAEYDVVYLVNENGQNKLMNETDLEKMIMFTPKGNILTWEELKTLST